MFERIRTSELADDLLHLSDVDIPEELRADVERSRKAARSEIQSAALSGPDFILVPSLKVDEEVWLTSPM